MWSSSVFYLFLLVVPFIVCDDEHVCKTLSPCSCMFPNGTGIDLSLGKSEYVSPYITHLDNSRKIFVMDIYYYFPCKNGKVNTTDDASGNTCDKELAICRETYNITIPPQSNVSQDHKYQMYGNNIGATFTNDGKSIVYNNDPSKATVQLECTPNAQYESVVVDNRELDNIILHLYSSQVCFKQLKEISTRSTGSTLLIILFTLTLLYLVLGICTKKCLMGAQGIEVIPNLDFWRDLPALCREGWVFLRSGCKVSPATSAPGTSSPNPNSYDSI